MCHFTAIASEIATEKLQENQKGLDFYGIHLLVVCAVGVCVLGATCGR